MRHYIFIIILAIILSILSFSCTNPAASVEIDGIDPDLIGYWKVLLMIGT